MSHVIAQGLSDNKPRLTKNGYVRIYAGVNLYETFIYLHYRGKGCGLHASLTLSIFISQKTLLKKMV